MRRKKVLLVSLVAGALITVPGCSMLPPVPGSGNAAEDVVPVVVEGVKGVVTAEALVEPDQWNQVAYAVGGTVTEVLITEGDLVQEGQVIARLDDAHQAAAVAQAEVGLRSAQARVGELKAGPRPQELQSAQAAIEAAQAQLDRVQASVRPEEIAPAEAALVVAEASLQKVLEGASEDMFIAARADLANADAARQQAQAAYDRVKTQPNIGARPESLQLQQATNAYEAAQARLNELERGASAADIAIARGQVQQAQAQIDVLKVPARSSDIAAAQAEIRRAEAQLSLIEEGLRPETIAMAEIAVDAAQVALGQAQLSLADTELYSPMTGTATDIGLQVGGQIVPGQPVLVLATLDRFTVRTIDLNELDVAEVAVGMPAVVTVDALPDVEFEGVVQEIALKSGSYHGDVVYDVTVGLADTELPETLRWGMTTMVRIKTD